MTMGPERIAGIVLAAGKSTRMGRLKQTLPWGRQSVTGAVIWTLIRAGVDLIVLVVGHRAEEVIMAEVGVPERVLKAAITMARRGVPWRLPQIKVAYNPDYEVGMASSVAAGMHAVTPEYCAAVVALADQPMVRPRTVRRLIDAWRKAGQRPEERPLAALPVFQGRRGHPILLSAGLRGQVLGLGEGSAEPPPGSSRTLRDVIGWAREHGGVLEVEVDDASILKDLDYPADYERLKPRGGFMRLRLGGRRCAWKSLRNAGRPCVWKGLRSPGRWQAKAVKSYEDGDGDLQ